MNASLAIISYQTLAKKNPSPLTTEAPDISVSNS